MGAEVVKLELPEGNDTLRSLAPVMGKHSLFWKVTNRGKKGITLDVRKPEGRALFLKLLPQFDVLVENFRTGTLDRWGLDIETLHRHNPGLIVLRLTGFGQTGPYAARPGFARIFEAMSGFTNLTGEAGGPPLHSNFPVGDAVAGLFCAFSIASEMVRIRSQPEAKGAEVDLSATEALFRLLDCLPVEHEMLGQVRRPEGNRASYTAPSNMYRSREGQFFTLVASSNPIFSRLCAAIGEPGLADDPRFNSNPARVENLVVLDNRLGKWFAGHDYAFIAARLEQSGIPFSKAYTIEDIEQDPHYIARGAIVRLPDPDYGTLPAPCAVPRVAGRPMIVPRTGPSVGEHNAQVYAEFGISAEELEQLKADGVV